MCATFSTMKNIEFKSNMTQFKTQLHVGSISQLFNHPWQREKCHLHPSWVVEQRLCWRGQMTCNWSKHQSLLLELGRNRKCYSVYSSHGERSEKNRFTATSSSSKINLSNFIGILNYPTQQTKEMKKLNEYF